MQQTANPELVGGHICQYHIPTDRDTELIADNSAEWNDILDIKSAGGLQETTLAEDRHAVIFSNHERAQATLEELKETTVI